MINITSFKLIIIIIISFIIGVTLSSAFFVFDNYYNRKRLKHNIQDFIEYAISVFVLLLDIAVFILDKFNNYFTIYDNDNHQINNSNLIIVITIAFIGVLSFYHLSSKVIFSDIKKKEQTINDNLLKIEKHIDAHYNSISFELLPKIESEVGVPKKNIQSEIWIITNDFFENTEKGKELRKAMASNLQNNVTYYYIVPSEKNKEICTLANKLQEMLKNKTVNGNFCYVVDDSLNFIPSEYFDIIMYLKRSNYGDEKTNYAESESKILYCFSKKTKDNDYNYIEVNNDDLWKKMTEYARTFKANYSNEFINIFE